MTYGNDNCGIIENKNLWKLWLFVHNCQKVHWFLGDQVEGHLVEVMSMIFIIRIPFEPDYQWSWSSPSWCPPCCTPPAPSWRCAPRRTVEGSRWRSWCRTARSCSCQSSRSQRCRGSQSRSWLSLLQIWRWQCSPCYQTDNTSGPCSVHISLPVDNENKKPSIDTLGKCVPHIFCLQ